MAQLDYSILLEKGLAVGPRILSHQDRNTLSPTYGSFGRRFWAWKTAAMPDASNQYGVYYLALLWSLDHPANSFYHDPRLQEWIAAGIRYWMGLQHRDGSFDQVFPQEHSVGATSYTVLAMLGSSRILGQGLDATRQSDLTHTVARAGNFLLAQEESYAFIANHVALFATTFHELWRQTGDRRYRDRCVAYLEKIVEQQSPEGWFPEYEGADPGYLTQCLYYLARLLQEGYDFLEEPLKKACNFLTAFIHPDGSVGGHYGSRNTTIAYPGGLALLADRLPAARTILHCLCRGLAQGVSPAPEALDFPNAIRLASNYLISWKHLQDCPIPEDDLRDYPLPWQLPQFRQEYPQAGLLAVGTPFYYAVIGLKKGGVFKIFDKGSQNLVLADWGYYARCGKQSVCTQIFFESKYVINKGEVSLEHPFFITPLTEMSPYKYLILLVLSLTVFRIKSVRESFKKFLVRLLMTRKRQIPARLKRSMTFSDQKVMVLDTIVPSPDSLKNLTGGRYFTGIHMASAQYFANSTGASPPVQVQTVGPRGVEVGYEVSFPFTPRAFPESVRITPK